MHQMGTVSLEIDHGGQNELWDRSQRGMEAGFEVAISDVRMIDIDRRLKKELDKTKQKKG